MAIIVLLLLETMAELYPILGGKMSSRRIQEPLRTPHWLGEERSYRSSGRLGHGSFDPAFSRSRRCVPYRQPFLDHAHAQTRVAVQGAQPQDRSVQNGGSSASQLHLHGSWGCTTGPTLQKQAPHWLALKVPPPSDTEPKLNWLAGSISPTASTSAKPRPAGVSARCLAPFTHELNLC